MPGIKGLNNSAENRFHKDTLPIVNFEQISYIVLLFLLLTLLAQSQQLKHQNNVWYLLKLNNKGSVFIANFEQISLITLMFLLLTLNQKMPVGMGFESILLNQQNVSITFFWKSVRDMRFCWIFRVCYGYFLNRLVFCQDEKKSFFSKQWFRQKHLAQILCINKVYYWVNGMSNIV